VSTHTFTVTITNGSHTFNKSQCPWLVRLVVVDNWCGEL